MALVPAIAALVGIGAVELWKSRLQRDAQVAASVILTVSGLWVYYLLGSSDTVIVQWIRPSALMSASVAAVLFGVETSGSHVQKHLTILGLFLAIAFSGPAAYASATVRSSHHGSSPTASSSRVDDDHGKADPRLVELLRNDTSNYRWEVAAIGTQTGAPLQLASNRPVMALGGFGGSRDVNNSMPLPRFQKLVNEKQIDYFVAPKAKSAAAKTEINIWVTSNFTHETFGSTQVYDLARALPPRTEKQ